MSRALNKTDRKVLVALWEWDRPYAPSFRELMDITGIKSTSHIRNVVNKLIGSDYAECLLTEDGCITPRTVHLTGKGFLEGLKILDETTA